MTSADEGYEIWYTEEYRVTSGWDPGNQGDVVESLTWHEIETETQDALTGLIMRAHGYTRIQAEKHFAGSGTDDEAAVMLIRHMFNSQTSPPLPPPLSSSSSHGRAARGGGGGGPRRRHNGVARPRRQRDTNSRYTAAMLRHLESAFRDDGVL